MRSREVTKKGGAAYRLHFSGDGGMGGLRVWQRLGVVATFLWVLGAGYTHYRIDTDSVAEQAQAQFQICSDVVEVHHANDFKACFNDARNKREAANRGLWSEVALAALAPPLVAWLLVYLTIVIFRWVWAGRSDS
jgi:hypothetical protein